MDKIKLGILDLLSILLPGAFFVSALYYYCHAHGFQITNDHFSNQLAGKVYDWLLPLVFLAFSYIAGHFIFIVASLLDDLIFEHIKRIFWTNNNLLAQILDLKTRKTGISDFKTINAFKWSCGWLLMKRPEMYTEVERYIAESKFFRSLTIVWLITIILLCKHLNPFILLSLIVATFLSLIRYLTQRQKSIRTAYEYMITASEEVFPPTTYPATLNTISKKTIKIGPFHKDDESRRIKIIFSDVKAFRLKLIKSLDLCFNPFYVEKNKQGMANNISKEIRWFFEVEKPAIEKWFSYRELEFSNSTSQTDRYLKDTALDKNIKQRGEKLEIKTRISSSLLIHINSFAKGYLEEWSKDVVDKNQTAKLLPPNFPNKEPEWLPIQKNRLLLKRTLEKNGSWKNHDVTEILPSACQVEYTKINVFSQQWYTFAAEWFGNIDESEVYKMITEISNDTILSDVNSFSYPAFVNRVINKKVNP